MIESKEPQLSGLTGIGTSMLPFFKSGDVVWFKQVPVSEIHPGNIIIYQKESNVVTHRVIQIKKDGGKTTLIARGDNRLGFGAPVASDQILGKAVQIGEKNLNHFKWKFVGRLIVLTVVMQASCHEFLSKSHLNHLRRLMEQKKMFPKIQISSWFRIITNPLLWSTRLNGKKIK